MSRDELKGVISATLRRWHRALDDADGMPPEMLLDELADILTTNKKLTQ
jgi:hypothetical protein